MQEPTEQSTTFKGNAGKPELDREGTIIRRKGQPDILKVKGFSAPLVGIPREKTIKFMASFKPIIISAVTAIWQRSHNQFIAYEKMPEPVKAIYDMFNFMIECEPKHDKFHIEFWAKVRDMMCFMMEDQPYLWRLQAAASKLKKDDRIDFTQDQLKWITTQEDFRYGKDE